MCNVSLSQTHAFIYLCPRHMHSDYYRCFHHIGSGDIMEGNLKLILGLIWTLILHYQISMGFSTDDGPKRGGKEALLQYIQVWFLSLLCVYKYLLCHSMDN